MIAKSEGNNSYVNPRLSYIYSAGGRVASSNSAC